MPAMPHISVQPRTIADPQNHRQDAKSAKASPGSLARLRRENGDPVAASRPGRSSSQTPHEVMQRRPANAFAISIEARQQVELVRELLDVLAVEDRCEVERGH